MFWRNAEDANKEAQKRIEMYREAAGIIPAVINAIHRFDGKVYNCRFQNALQEEAKNVYANKTEYYIEVYMWFNGRHINLARIKTEELIDGKRIPAGKMIESARGYQSSHLKTAYEIETSLQQVEQCKAYLREMKEKIENFTAKIPGDVREIYNIPLYVRFS